MRCALSAALALGILSCLPATSRAAEDMPVPATQPWTARGNEPNWVLTFDAGRIVYRAADGTVHADAGRSEPEFRDGAWIYRAPQADLTVSLRRKVCRDTMTGMPSPISVAVQTAGKAVTGCGGDPSELLAGQWRVTTIGNQPVPDDVTVDLDFDIAAGNVTGSSGCNRYFGGLKLSGEGLSFAKGMAGSMMACEEHQATIERAFLAAMATVQRFDIGPDGALLLITADGAIKARRKAA